MSKCLKCDVCGRTEPSASINFSKRPVNWCKYWFDSQGGSWERLDVCDDCWEGFKEYMKAKVQK